MEWVFASVLFLTLVFFLYRHPRGTIKTLGVVLGIGFLALAIALIQKHLDEAEEAKVGMTATAAFDGQCSDPTMLAVYISNRSDKPVERVEFRIAATIPGRSSDLAKYNSYTSDFIIEPGKYVSLCYLAPELRESLSPPPDLKWSIAYRSITFGK